MELPSGWASGPLSDFVAPRGEKVSPPDFPKLPFIGMDHVEAHTTKIVGSVPSRQMKSRASRFRENDVLYGRLRPYLNKVAQPKFDGLASGEFIVFEGNELIDSSFLRYRLHARDFVNFASHLNEGDRPRVNFNQIGNFEVQVPPPGEQRRIVKRIETLFDEIDQGVESLRDAKRAVKLYRQSLLKSAFEGRLTADWRAKNPDKLESPEVLLASIREEREESFRAALDEWEEATAEWRDNGEFGKKPTKPKLPKTVAERSDGQLATPTTWATVPLQRIALEAILGKMLDRQKNRGQPRPYLGNINLRWGLFKVDPEKLIPIEDHEVPRYAVRKGDLVICEGGEPGRCAVWKGEDDKVFIQKALHRVRFTASYSPMFAYYYFRFATVAGLLDKHFTGSTIKHLTGKALEEVLLPICSPAEQAEIVRILNEHLAATNTLEAEIDVNFTRGEALRQSILKQAFAGQLVPQNPDDESAAILLERIKAEKASQKPKGTARKRKAAIA
ncbi:MAG: restriction endonuclease subunit S [Gammaproteobacteria bacterium]|nr:restriction endonuclease subunit S [Gammaproteobacteria bacterium]MDE0273857.1 restriction endonuclease subunit S [Gammaproteobacteria bacterium]